MKTWKKPEIQKIEILSGTTVGKENTGKNTDLRS